MSEKRAKYRYYKLLSRRSDTVIYDVKGQKTAWKTNGVIGSTFKRWHRIKPPQRRRNGIERSPRKRKVGFRIPAATRVFKAPIVIGVNVTGPRK